MRRSSILFTPQQILSTPAGQRADNREKIEQAGGKQVKKAKYGNVGVGIDGYYFRSIRESRRYLQLRALLTAGQIEHLECQVPYELNDEGKFSFKYIADFRYTDKVTGLQVVEDSKGAKTKRYNKCKKLMKSIYNIEIVEK